LVGGIPHIPAHAVESAKNLTFDMS